MKMNLSPVFIVCLLLAMGSNSLADPAEGDRVRVEHGGQQTTGLLTSIDDFSLTLDSGSQALVIQRTDVTKIEVSTGRKGHTLTGALVGTATGVLVGVIANAADDSEDNVGEEIADDVLGPSVTIGLGIVGGLTGALVGYLIKSDQWSETALSGATLGIAPLRNGRLQVSVAWKTRF